MVVVLRAVVHQVVVVILLIYQLHQKMDMYLKDGEQVHLVHQVVQVV